MIISASRRTDLPCFYTEWFFRRLREGVVCVRNPMNPRQVSRIALRPETLDGIVFWTKNPAPLLPRLKELGEIPYYVQFTLNAYGADLEPGVPSKQETVVPTFQALSRRIGAERVIWRYDPILLTPHYTAAYHVQYFEALARRLAGYTDTCVISFADDYRHLRRTAQELQFRFPDAAVMRELAGQFSDIAGKCGLTLVTCAEAQDLSEFGIGHGQCIDAARLERISGHRLAVERDRNQRPACGCAASVDIGMYDSCGNGCRYCYANHSTAAVQRNCRAHDPASPLLYGTLSPEDQIRDRQFPSCRISQLDFWEVSP